LPFPLEIRGRDNFFTSYPYFQLNTLDRWDYPRTGIKLDAEYDITYGQSPAFKITENGAPVNADSLNQGAKDYSRVLLDAIHYVPLGKKSTLFWEAQSGINFRYQVTRVNDFLVGGLTDQFHNQITFAGLAEGTINTSSIGTLGLGYRYEVYPLLYLTARENVGLYNFLNVRDRLVPPSFLSGSALSLGYDSPIGPIEFSLMYSEQSQVVLGYVNIGIHF
jgi:NTE family protein